MQHRSEKARGDIVRIGKESTPRGLAIPFFSAIIRDTGPSSLQSIEGTIMAIELEGTTAQSKGSIPFCALLLGMSLLTKRERQGKIGMVKTSRSLASMVLSAWFSSELQLKMLSIPRFSPLVDTYALKGK
jgi:hypothetical protein